MCSHLFGLWYICPRERLHISQLIICHPCIVVGCSIAQGKKSKHCGFRLWWHFPCITTMNISPASLCSFQLQSSTSTTYRYEMSAKNPLSPVLWWVGHLSRLSFSQSREMGARYLNVTANFIRPSGCGCCGCSSMNIRPCWLNIIIAAAPIVGIAGTGWLKT